MVLPLRLTLASALLLAPACARTGPTSVEPEPSVTPVEAEGQGAGEVEGPTARDAPEQVERDGVVLGLWPDECLLLAESDRARISHRFEFPGPCHFAVGADGAPRVVETDSGPAWLIESSRPSERDCDTALRVVVLGREGPRLSRAEQRVAMCAPNEWDEMMFHVLANDPVEFGTDGVRP
jgi:hypothetical protein